MNKVQVVIVGAGPTGLMAANLLGQAGIDALVLERHTGLSEEARAITIDDEGLRICQAVGLAEEICKQALLNLSAYYVSQRRLLVRVAPQHQPNGYPLISTFYQPDFEAVLLRGLERFPSVNIHFGQTVETIKQNDDGVVLTVRTAENTEESLQCAYLLACDGGKSGLRQALGITLHPPRLRALFSTPLRNSKPRRSAKQRRRFIARRPASAGEVPTNIPRSAPHPWFRALIKFDKAVHPQRKDHATQRWLVIDYKEHNQQSERIIFYCNPARPAVSVQGPDQRKRWEFMLKPGERDEDLLDENTIASMIMQAEATLPEGLRTTKSAVEQIQIERKVVYKFYATIASTFACGRVFLLGDAAHLMPPFGGQGMNSGLRDAHNLCWKLKLVIEGHASPRLLASYQQERYIHAARMITFSSLLGKLIMPTNPLLAWARDRFLLGISHIPFVHTQLSEMRVKPQPRHTQGFLLPEKGSQLVGRLLPQPYVMQSGARIRLDEVLGAGFTLLRLYENPDEAFMGFESELWTRLNLCRVCVLPRWAAEEKPITWSSPSHNPFTNSPSPSALQRHRFIARRPASAGDVPTNMLHNSQHPPLIGPPLNPYPRSKEKSRRFDVVENSNHSRHNVITDTDGVLVKFLHGRQDLLVLVRPDHYIMAIFHIKQIKYVEQALWYLVRVS